jgi:hypothetical protein
MGTTRHDGREDMTLRDEWSRLSPTAVAIFAVAALSFLWCTSAAVAGQTTAGYVPPRTADGHPDLQGVWQTLNTAAWDIEDHNARLGVPAGRGVVEGGPLPYQPSALARKQQNARDRAVLDTEVKCHILGVPRMTYMPYPFRIVQQREKITILYEYLGVARFLYMNGNPHPKGPIEWYMGDSRARWEGITLVVDVVHFTDLTWLDRAGNFHSDALHVVERYTPTGPDHMRYDVTIEDPKVFTRPWTMSMTLYRRQESNLELLENECMAYRLEEAWDTPNPIPQ